ncbi:MAG TPA: hypothetical protein VIS05_06210 [Ilumatobacter sp.]
MNFAAGEVIANGAIIPLGSGGRICVFSSQSTHLILDVAGYHVAAYPNRLLFARPS